jgi:hypothetical protein
MDTTLVKLPEMEPYAWATEHFGELDLGHEQREQRAITIAAAFATRPGKSIPQTFDNWYDVKAAYLFFANPAVTPDGLQATHRELTLARLQQPGTYLLVEDTTEPSWGGQKKRPGLGPVGDRHSTRQGYQLHTTLALCWPEQRWKLEAQAHRPALEIIGIADQQAVVRQPVSKHETRAERLQRARESDIWDTATTRLGTAPADARVRWKRVCDRGADIFEFLDGCAAEGHGFVVRAAQDRALVDEADQPAGHLFATARCQPSLGEFNLELRGRDGQAARTAQLSVSATVVRLRSPWRPGKGRGTQAPICCTVVRVWEAAPPAGVEGLEWILLCDEAITTFAQAQTIAVQYATRWVVEEFHKALKTGLGLEKLQLETGAELMAAGALFSVVALRLLHLREVVRLVPDAPAEASGLSPLELEVLGAKTKRTLTTVRDVALAVGRLGGHLNRKSDGLPGWITLWRGYVTLQTLVEGARLVHKLKKVG